MRLAPYQEDGEHGTSMLVKILLGGPALIKGTTDTGHPLPSNINSADPWTTWVWTAQFTYMQIFFNSKYCTIRVGGIMGLEEPWKRRTDYRLWKNFWQQRRSASLTLIWFNLPQRGIHSYSIVKLLNPEDRRDRRKGSSSKEQLIILAQGKLQNNSQ